MNAVKYFFPPHLTNFPPSLLPSSPLPSLLPSPPPSPFISFPRHTAETWRRRNDWCKKFQATNNVKDLTQAWELYYHVFRRIIQTTASGEGGDERKRKEGEGRGSERKRKEGGEGGKGKRRMRGGRRSRRRGRVKRVKGALILI